MKKLFFASALLFLFLPFYMFSQSAFSTGYEKGYKEGYCYEDFGCIAPNAPIAPNPKIGYDSYQDGYNKGFIDGKSAKSGNSPSESSQVGRRQIVKDNLDYDAIGAASSSGNQPIPISNETAQQVGDAFAAAIIAGQISKAKKKLRKLPTQYKEFPNMVTAFEIYNAATTIINLDIKPKTAEELEMARKSIFKTYNFNTDLFADDVLNSVRMYEGNWRTYKKENKNFAKSEEKKLKEYKKSSKK